MHVTPGADFGDGHDHFFDDDIWDMPPMDDDMETLEETQVEDGGDVEEDEEESLPHESDDDDTPMDWANYVPTPPEPTTHALHEDALKKVYADAQINVLTAATFIWTLSRSAGWKRTDVEALLKFLHHDLLPQGNLMPRSLHRLRNILGEADLHNCTYHMCVDGCVVWHRKDERRLKMMRNAGEQCPKCSKPLFEREGRNWKPCRTIHYFGLANLVR